jgi:Mn2+/Fe2+ NRAMP family transporter
MTMVLKWFSIVLFVYCIVPFLVKLDWQKVFISTFNFHIEWNKEYLAILVALFGTTISPYLFFWQTAMSVEESNHNIDLRINQMIKDMRIDVNVGMLLSNVVMYFIILTTGSVLFTAGITNIETVEQAAEALKPLAGEFAHLLFALGIIVSGLLSIPVLGGCLGYILCYAFGWEKGMDKKPQEAKEFYITISSAIVAGLILNIFNLDPIKSLIYTAIAYGIISPFMIAVILHISNNSKIMGKYVNGVVSNVLGVLALILMGVVAIALLFTLIF